MTKVSPLEIKNLNEYLHNNDISNFLINLKYIIKNYYSIDELAKSADISKGTLYRILDKDANPQLLTLMKLIKVMGLTLSIVEK